MRECDVQELELNKMRSSKEKFRTYSNALKEMSVNLSLCKIQGEKLELFFYKLKSKLQEREPGMLESF